jgi:hypothetical protein
MRYLLVSVGKSNNHITNSNIYLKAMYAESIHTGIDEGSAFLPTLKNGVYQIRPYGPPEINVSIVQYLF